MSATLKCRKCGLQHPVSNTSNMGTMRQEAPGWDGLWDVSNGLEFAWYCPDCIMVIKVTLESLQKAIGPLAIRRANFLPLLPATEPDAPGKG
jgi:hypothetical protein